MNSAARSEEADLASIPKLVDELNISPRQIAAVAHRHGARVLVDAAQLAPHRRIDIAALGVDYVALSGHKLYAPFGGGVLVGRRDWLDAAEPYLPGGGAATAVSGDSAQWAPAPARSCSHMSKPPNWPRPCTVGRLTKKICASLMP